MLLHQGKLLVAPASSSREPGRGPLALQPCSFAAAGVAAPGGAPPHWLPLVVSGQRLLASIDLPASGEEQQPEQQQQKQPCLFLGLDEEGGAVFAAVAPPALLPLLPPPPPPRGSSAPDQPPSSQEAAVVEAPEGSCWVDVRNAGQQMTGADAAVSALAVGLAAWHTSAAFCGRSGAPMVRARHLPAPDCSSPFPVPLAVERCRASPPLTCRAGGQQRRPFAHAGGGADRQRQRPSPRLPAR